MFISKNYYHINNENFYYKIIDKIDLPSERCIIYLNGDVGSGKTTFVKSFVSHMGYMTSVTSPTFTIVNEYLFKTKKMYHYDFYRLKNHNELSEIGIDYYLDQPGIHFIEWPNDFKKYLPPPDINVSLMMLPESRLIKVEINND